MQIGIVGLGKMGSSIALHASTKGHGVVGYDVDYESRGLSSARGLPTVDSIAALVHALRVPRTVLVYVPHGRATEQVLRELEQRLGPADVVVDGGNSNWKSARSWNLRFAARGIEFLDVGTSGGLEGARSGACFMVGGSAGGFALIEPLLSDLAVPGGIIHAGPAGAGHFVKLIHNAIEFGMLQALGEGVDLLRHSDFELDIARLFNTWRHGSVIRGWLVDLLAAGLSTHPLEALSSYVEDTREVRWAIEYALENEVWIPVIAQAELALYRYRDPESAAGKAVALMRHGFGGHPLHTKTTDA